MKCKLNVIFDIDETFVHYMTMERWSLVPAQDKPKYMTVMRPGDPGGYVIRPFMRDLFEYCRDTDCNICLWTWSDHKYAMDVADILYSLIGIRPYMILSQKHAERSLSISPQGYHKDLNMIWYGVKRAVKSPDGSKMIVGTYREPEPDAGGYVLQKRDWYGLTDEVMRGQSCFAECNTILIDDLPANTVNPANRFNSITVESFSLFGDDRSDKSLGKYRDLSENTAFKDVIAILKCVRPAAEGCYDGSRRKTHIFSPANIKKYKLEKFLKRIRLILYKRTESGEKVPADETIVPAIGVGNHSHFLPQTRRSQTRKRSR